MKCPDIFRICIWLIIASFLDFLIYELFGTGRCPVAVRLLVELPSCDSDLHRLMSSKKVARISLESQNIRCNVFVCKDEINSALLCICASLAGGLPVDPAPLAGICSTVKPASFGGHVDDRR